MTDRERIELEIKHLSESRAAVLAWDKANGHKIYEYSGQGASDKRCLAAARRRLRALGAGSPKLRWANVTHGFRG